MFLFEDKLDFKAKKLVKKSIFQMPVDKMPVAVVLTLKYANYFLIFEFYIKLSFFYGIICWYLIMPVASGEAQISKNVIFCLRGLYFLSDTDPF